VRVLNDRLHHIRALNADVADWFQVRSLLGSEDVNAKNSAQERRRIEEAYVAGLQRLANKPLSQDNLELG
jgi:F-BAR domain only protein